MNHPTIEQDTPAWIFYVWASFGLALLFTAFGIFWLPVDPWIKGYLGIAFLYLTGATFVLAKTVRDNHEARKIVNRVVDAKTEKILSEYELRNA